MSIGKNTVIICNTFALTHLALFCSKNLLTELDAMLQLVCQTHVETTKQIELEKRLHQLRLQCKAVEDELKHQKKRTSSMLPEIVAKQKAVETRKTVSRKMSLYCDRMGRKFFGDDYKYEFRSICWQL